MPHEILRCHNSRFEVSSGAAPVAWSSLRPPCAEKHIVKLNSCEARSPVIRTPHPESHFPPRRVHNPVHNVTSRELLPDAAGSSPVQAARASRARLERFFFGLYFIKNKTLKIKACVQITTKGVSVFTSDECLAPLNDELSLRDCCSLKADIVNVIRDLIIEKNTASVVLSDTRFINKSECCF